MQSEHTNTHASLFIVLIPFHLFIFYLLISLRWCVCVFLLLWWQKIKCKGKRKTPNRNENEQFCWQANKEREEGSVQAKAISMENTAQNQEKHKLCKREMLNLVLCLCVQIFVDWAELKIAKNCTHLVWYTWLFFFCGVTFVCGSDGAHRSQHHYYGLIELVCAQWLIELIL